jgi:hypothetical protein
MFSSEESSSAEGQEWADIGPGSAESMRFDRKGRKARRETPDIPRPGEPKFERGVRKILDNLMTWIW